MQYPVSSFIRYIKYFLSGASVKSSGRKTLSSVYYIGKYLI